MLFISLAADLLFHLLLLWVFSRFCFALYNISPFHPLYHFPGPKIAAASYIYEAYHDFWCRGQYTNVIARMHQKYGPIVRINPDELHCSDIAFTEEIYAGSGRVRDKWQHQLNTGGAGPVSVTGFSTVSHELHRIRRAPLAKYFSRQQIFALESEVLNIAHQMADKMLALAGKGAFDVKQAFNCATADIISQYSFGQSMGFVEQDGWEPNFSSWVQSFFRSAYMMRHNFFARKLVQLMPFMARYLGKDVQTIFTIMYNTIPGYITATLENPSEGRVFADMVNDTETLSEEDKYRLCGEGFNLLMAGTETTASVLTVFTHRVLEKPAIHERLVSDLTNARLDAQNLKWVSLEKCSYLWATLHECLRMMPGVSHRSARIAREEDLHYKSADGKTMWVIPRGTPIGMSPMINHWDIDAFPNPDDFSPERWLLPDGQPDHQLERNLIAFGKGSRSCIGENLANCEMFLIAAVMVLRVLSKATLMDQEDSICYDHDMIVPQTKKGSISSRISIF